MQIKKDYKNSTTASYRVTASYRLILYNIFNKLSDDDLVSIFNIYTKLGIQGPCLSFAVEILQDRGILDG